MIRLFVYGTLMKGFGLNQELQGEPFEGEASTGKGYKLHDLGAFPAMSEGGEGKVKGELYGISPETLKTLDSIEGHPTFYKRQRIVLEDGTIAQAYLINRCKQEVIESGCFRSHREEKKYSKSEKGAIFI